MHNSMHKVSMLQYIVKFKLKLTQIMKSSIVCEHMREIKRGEGEGILFKW